MNLNDLLQEHQIEPRHLERFMRTLKEQCLYLQRFQTLEEARRIIAAFITRYNHEWLIERLDYRTPAQARAEGWRAAA
jgi:transposase InsO family protein